VCGSDVHSITGGWGEVPLPLCVGHEVIGKAVKVGSKVSTVKVGDRVGVGAQIQSCLECKQCKNDNENYCPKQVDTYGAPYPDGTISQGGYSSHIRAHEYFTFPIPDSIPSIEAAPMMCAGLTVYSPLVRGGVGPGKKVAIVGIGGLGHFAIMFANALGAEVTAISHSPQKKDDAMKLGAKHFVSSQEEGWAKPLAFEFDFVLNSADMGHKMNMKDYVSILNVNGKLNHVGLPDGPLPELQAQDFAANGAFMGTTHIGCRTEMLAMLKLVEDHKLTPYIETVGISEEGCAKAVQGVHDNKVRYRYTLTNYDKAFGKRE
jgi:alcohol dehydrogenase (NADP+)